MSTSERLFMSLKSVKNKGPLKNKNILICSSNILVVFFVLLRNLIHDFLFTSSSFCFINFFFSSSLPYLPLYSSFLSLFFVIFFRVFFSTRVFFFNYALFLSSSFSCLFYSFFLFKLFLFIFFFLPLPHSPFSFPIHPTCLLFFSRPFLLLLHIFFFLLFPPILTFLPLPSFPAYSYLFSFS